MRSQQLQITSNLNEDNEEWPEIMSQIRQLKAQKHRLANEIIDFLSWLTSSFIPGIGYFIVQEDVFLLAPLRDAYKEYFTQDKLIHLANHHGYSLDVLIKAYQHYLKTHDLKAPIQSRTFKMTHDLYNQYRKIADSISHDPLLSLKDNLITNFANINVNTTLLGFEVTEKVLGIFLIVSSPVLSYAISLPVKSIYHHFFSSENKIQRLLSYREAKDYLRKLQKETLTEKAQYYRFRAYMHIFIGIIFASMVTRMLTESAFSFELCCLMFSTVISLCRQGYIRAEEYYSEYCFENRLQKAKLSFEEALKFTQGQFDLHKGSTLAESYLTFKTYSTYKELSISVVNQVVKDILLKNGIQILEYSNTTHTFEIVTLKRQKIASIKAQVQEYLDKLADIKILSKQIKACFPNIEIVKNISLIKGLPASAFLLNIALDDEQLNQVKKIFSASAVNCLGKGFSIAGSIPADPASLMPFSIKKEALLLVSQTRHDSYASIHKKLNLRAKPAPTVTLELPLVMKSDCVVRHVWPSGKVYDTHKKNNSIIPVNHPFFHETHFVQFAIPHGFFGNNSDVYQKIKNKVEEARMVNGRKGEQGLQIRTETVKNAADEWFESSMRCKVLGEFGDGRAYAKKETTTDGRYHLFAFIGYNPVAHKPEEKKKAQQLSRRMQ